MEPLPIIEVLFHERQWFFSVLKLVDSLTKVITLYFTPQGVSFSFIDKLRNSMHRYTFASDELLVYTYRVKRDEELEPFFNITVVISDLKGTLASTNKKASTRMLIYEGRPDELVIVNSDSVANSDIVSIRHEPPVDFAEELDAPVGASEAALIPVCSISTSMLVESVKIPSGSKCKDIEFSLSPTTLSINRNKSDGSVQPRTLEFKPNPEYLEYFKEIPMFNIKVPYGISIKALQQLSTISHGGGLIRVFINEQPGPLHDGYIHFRGVIGTIGHFDIRLLATPKK